MVEFCVSGSTRTVHRAIVGLRMETTWIALRIFLIMALIKLSISTTPSVAQQRFLFFHPRLAGWVIVEFPSVPANELDAAVFALLPTAVENYFVRKNASRCNFAFLINKLPNVTFPFRTAFCSDQLVSAIKSGELSGDDFEAARQDRYKQLEYLTIDSSKPAYDGRVYGLFARMLRLAYKPGTLHAHYNAMDKQSLSRQHAHLLAEHFIALLTQGKLRVELIQKLPDSPQKAGYWQLDNQALLIPQRDEVHQLDAETFPLAFLVRTRFRIGEAHEQESALTDIASVQKFCPEITPDRRLYWWRPPVPTQWFDYNVRAGCLANEAGWLLIYATRDLDLLQLPKASLESLAHAVARDVRSSASLYENPEAVVFTYVGIAYNK